MENVQLIFQRIGCHRYARGHAGRGVRRRNGHAVGLVLAHEQEVGRRSVRSVAIVANIRIGPPLFVVDGNQVAIRGGPLHLVRYKSPNARAVVGGDDLLQAHIGAKEIEVADGKLIAFAVCDSVAGQFAVVIHIDRRAVRVVAHATGGAADLALDYVRDDQLQYIRIVYAHEHRIHTPRLVRIRVFGSCVHGDGVGVFETRGLNCRERYRSVGDGGALAHLFARLLDGIFHIGVCRGGADGVLDCRQIVIIYGVAVQRFESDLEGCLLDDNIRRHGKILGFGRKAVDVAAQIGRTHDHCVDTRVGKLSTGYGDMR